MEQMNELIARLPKSLYMKGPAHVWRTGVPYLRERIALELRRDIEHCEDPMGQASDIIELFDSDSIDINYRGTESLPPQLDTYVRRTTGPQGNVYIFEDVSLIGRRPVIETNGMQFTASWFGVNTPFYDRQRREVKRNLPLSASPDWAGAFSSVQKVDSGFLLLTERGIGFHHWFFEVLPKLWWYEKLIDKTDCSPKLIAHSPLETYHKRSLELMGYDADSVIEHSHRYSEVEKLVLAPHPIRLKGNQVQSLPVQLKWVGDQIKSGLNDIDSGFGNRIYISREDANRRHVVNEDEVMDTLSELGFERYEPGRLSLEDQIRLFANADVIVGPHGLAYTNLIYTNNARLIEMFPENGATATYFVAAEELDIEYDCLECPAVERRKNIRPRDKDLHVPIDELRHKVEEYVEQARSEVKSSTDR